MLHNTRSNRKDSTVDHQNQPAPSSRGRLLKRATRIVIFIVVLTFVISLVLVGNYWGWRDWLKVAIIPFGISVITALLGIFVSWWLARQQQQQAQQRAYEQRRRDEEHKQEEKLEKYLDQMRQVSLDKATHEEGESDKVRAWVRARTLAVLKELDAEHNRSVLQFLIDSELLGVSDFREADLEGADLRGANLRGVDLSGSNLQAANLSHATLRKANLRNADLRNADLNNAYLNDADLRLADLREADLGQAYMQDANLFCADLRGVKLEHANLSGVDLDSANLDKADSRASASTTRSHNMTSCRPNLLSPR